MKGGGRSPGIWAVAAMAFLVAGIPFGAATTGLSAEAVEVGPAILQGPTRLAWLEGTQSVPDLVVEITASNVEGTLYETRYLDGPTLPTIVGERAIELDVPVPTDDDRSLEGGPITLTLLQAAADHRMGIRAEPSAPLGGTLETDATMIHSQDGARMDGEGIGERQGDTEGSDADASFRATEVPGSVLIAEVSEGPASFTLEGDLTLEVDEMDFQLESTGSTQELRTVTYHEEAAPGGPEVVEVDGFLRLHLTDARITLVAGDLSGLLQFAAPSLDVTPTGHVTFVNADGLLPTAVEGIFLEGESYTITDALPFTATGSGDRMAVVVEEPPAPGAFTAMVQAAVSPFQEASQTLLFIAVVSVGFLVAVLAAAALASPSMGRVESAIGDGRYRRAAKMAGRILSRHPQAENAQVARAVALSKSGDHSQVIREVEASLSKSDPSDGVLHYVLGLAYMETGRHKEAAARFQEAMARTPELGPEVERILPTRRRGPTYGYV